MENSEKQSGWRISVWQSGNRWQAEARWIPLGDEPVPDHYHLVSHITEEGARRAIEALVAADEWKTPEAVEPDDADVIVIDYTNWRGERRKRRVIPRPYSLVFAASKWHPEKQWLFDAWDVEKGEMRQFAMCGVHSSRPVHE